MKLNYPNLSQFYESNISTLDLSADFKFAIAVCMLEENMLEIGRFWRNTYLCQAIELDRLPDIEAVIEVFAKIAALDIGERIDWKAVDSTLASSSYNGMDSGAGYSKLRALSRDAFRKFASTTRRDGNTFSHQARSIEDSEIDEIVYSVQRDGYTIVKGFFAKEFIEELNELTRIIGRTEKDAGVGHLYSEFYNQRIYNLAAKDINYRHILENPTLNLVLEKLFERDTLHLTYSLSSFAANTINPGTEVGFPHIDSMVPDPIPPWLMRCLLAVPLVDVSVENGATRIVPGSHKECSWPRGNFEAREIPLLAEAGDILLWDGLIWHRSGANNSVNARTMLLITFAASFFREIASEEDHPQIIPTELAEQFSPHVRRLLGFGRGAKEAASFNLSSSSYCKSPVRSMQ